MRSAGAEGRSPALSSLARIKASIGVRTHAGSETRGIPGLFGGTNDQWTGSSAETGTQASRTRQQEIKRRRIANLGGGRRCGYPWSRHRARQAAAGLCLPHKWGLTYCPRIIQQEARRNRLSVVSSSRAYCAYL